MDKTMFLFYKNALLGSSMIEPLCDDYKARWKACGDDKEKLVRLSLCQQSAPYFATMCYLGRGVSKEYCKEHFGDYINGVLFDNCDEVQGSYKYGMFIDARDEVTLEADVAQFLWCDGLSVTLPQTKCPRLYVSNGSTLHITLEGYNTPQIYLFDNSKVVIEDASEESKVLVFCYSQDASVVKGKYCLIEPKVFQKDLRL